MTEAVDSLGMADGTRAADHEAMQVMFDNQYRTDHGNVYQRINAVMGMVRTVSKTRKHDAHKFRFSGHEDVTDAIRDAMVQCGLVAVPNVLGWRRAETLLSCDVEVAYVNIDDPEDRFTVQVLGESFSQDGARTGAMMPNDLQAGKALSYAIKQAHLKTFMLLGDATEDNEAARAPVVPTREEQAAANPVSEQDMVSLVNLFASAQDRAGLEAARVKASELNKRLNSEQLRTVTGAFQAAMQRLGLK